MRFLPLFAGSLALGVFVLLGRPEAGSPGASEDPGFSLLQPVALEPAAAEELPLRRGTSLRELRIVDALTGALLEVPVEVLAPNLGSADLHTAEICDMSSLPAGTLLRYPLGDGEAFEIPLAGCLRDEPETWTLAIPYSCAVRVELPADRHAESAQVGVFLCRPPAETGSQPVDRPPPFQVEGLDMTAEGRLWWELSAGSAMVLASERGEVQDGVVRCSAAAAGPALLSLNCADGASGFARLELQPGRELTVRPELRSRPRITGILLDEEGNPVPNEPVHLTVALDLADYDFRPGDPHGFVALRDHGVMHHRIGERLRTDSAGRFEAVVPRGREYALYSHARGRYVFWSTLEEPTAQLDGKEIVLRLEPPTAENSVAVVLLRPDGSPFSDAALLFTIPGDLPFMRQWPTDMPVDEQGRRLIPGVSAGDTFCVLVKHPDLRGGLYATPYGVVGTSRQIVVQLPAEAWLPAQ